MIIQNYDGINDFRGYTLNRRMWYSWHNYLSQTSRRYMCTPYQGQSPTQLSNGDSPGDPSRTANQSTANYVVEWNSPSQDQQYNWVWIAKKDMDSLSLSM